MDILSVDPRHRSNPLWMIAFLCVTLVSAFWFGSQELPVGTANGTYENGCCGTIQLKNGQMSFHGNYMGYVIKQDKVGVYVLPANYVGVRDGRTVEFEHDTGALILRLNDRGHPKKLELMGQGVASGFYMFDRVAS